MKLEKQCCSLDLAKRLKELGVKQDGIWKWYVSNDGKETILSNGGKLPSEYLYTFTESCSAFTVAELGELISNHCNEWSQGWDDSGCFWHFQYGGRGCGNMLEGFGEKFAATDVDEEDAKESSEANARAALLVHILESNLPASHRG